MEDRKRSYEKILEDLHQQANILYYLHETKRLCEHLNKLDRITLKDGFNFQAYLGGKEIVIC